jgi:hypothetical protein
MSLFTRVLFVFSIFALAFALASCQRPVAPAAEDPRLDPVQVAPDARRYVIQPGASMLQIFVYREGRLARLGHNHVLSSTQLSGAVYLAPDRLDSSVELRLPMASLEVDRAELRAAAGPDFPGVVDAEAIAGTRKNMLGELQLDVARYPDLILRSRRVTGAGDELQLTMELAFKSAVRTISVPVVLTWAGEEIVATGSFSVAQTELGLEPFSALLGALRVRDVVDISFRLVAAEQ